MNNDSEELRILKDSVKKCRAIMQNSITAHNNLLESEEHQQCRDSIKLKIDAKLNMLEIYDKWLVNA